MAASLSGDKMVMNIKDEKGNGKNFKSESLEIKDLNNLKVEEYYIHPKLKEDFDDLKTTVSGINDFGEEMGARNYLFTGPAGTGKTLGAMVLSKELGMPFCDISGYVKGQAQFIAQVFEELRKISQNNGKGVLAFIDEIEGLSSRENIVDPMQYQSLTQILSQMDGVENNNGVFIIGTTNKPNDLDEALRSRFSEEIEFLPPDQNGRYEILKIHADGKGGHKFKVAGEDLKKLSEVTYGYVGRDLKQVLNRAFTHAKKNNKNDVNFNDLEYGLKKTKPSAIRDMPFVEPKASLKDLVGYEDHKSVLKNILSKNNESVILMYGPKGTGKTLFSEALAGEFGYNFMLLKGSELESKWVGESKDRVEKVIKRAKQLSPCIVCFDEISSFIERKGVLSHKDSQTGYLQSVLSRPPEGVYILATDNNPDFLRGPFIDRFIHRLYFGMPSNDEQLLLWGKYAPEADAEKLVSVNNNLSCRDVAYACQRIKDYGAENLEAYERIIKNISKNDAGKYKTLVNEIGDSVADYKMLKEFRSKT